MSTTKIKVILKHAAVYFVVVAIFLTFLFKEKVASAAFSDGIEDVAFYASVPTFNGPFSFVRSQPDGKVLISGGFNRINGVFRGPFVRLNSDGTEDTTFSTNLGTGFLPANVSTRIFTLGVQGDGKIVVGGNMTNLDSNPVNYLIRLNSDGTEDTTFSTNLGTGFDNPIQTGVIQSDGKIVVGGNFTTFNGNPASRLVRLNADGTEDTAFSLSMGSGFDNGIEVGVIQSDGKIVVGGNFTTFNGNPASRLVRLNADGTEDTAFSLSMGSGFDNGIEVGVIQSDGKIVVGGNFTTFNGNPASRLVRLNADGTEDTAFSLSMGSGFDGHIFTIASQSDGKLILGGDFTILNGITTPYYFIRLNSDGTEDTAFSLNIGYAFDYPVNGTFIQGDGQVLAVGDFGDFNGNARDRIIRLSAPIPVPAPAPVVLQDGGGTYRLGGCMDQEAKNYERYATYQSGTCVYWEKETPPAIIVPTQAQTVNSGDVKPSIITYQKSKRTGLLQVTSNPRTPVNSAIRKRAVKEAQEKNHFLAIPALSLVQPILTLTELDPLLHESWILPWTSTPDKGGNTVIVAHSYSTRDLKNPRSTFFDLDKLVAKDIIEVAWQGKKYTYEVLDNAQYTPDSIWLEDNTEEPILTLYGCGKFTTSYRQVVRARLVDSK